MFKVFMKNIFLLVIAGLMLSGCFHDPKETALENCANSRVMDKYYSINNDLSENSFLIQKINKKLDKSFANSNIEASINLVAKSKKTMMEFTESNFNLNEDETYEILNKSYFNRSGFSDEVMTLLGMNHDPEEAIEKINGTEEQKNQFKEIIQEYNRQRELLKFNKKFKEKMITKTFLEMKMKDKFLEERYQKFYQRCERIYNELPSSFINKWEHNTELKEFLN